MTTTIDNAGRVVIPKALRERAALTPGMELDVEYKDGKIEIEPASKQVQVRKVGSVLVAVAPRGTAPLRAGTVRQIVEEAREERTRGRFRK
jgi:AbrB family looped-hinge helix DNA binding protein